MIYGPESFVGLHALVIPRARSPSRVLVVAHALPGRRGVDHPEPCAGEVRAIRDAHGRMMIAMTHNTDIADAFEREADDPNFFYLFSPKGYALGINVVLHVLTH